MKLWTEMKRDTDGEWFANDPDPYQCKGAIARDAAAAHALMEAITAWGKHPGYQGGESWVKKRADEIMAGWGFDSGEDA
jgi:hypothetical protein